MELNKRKAINDKLKKYCYFSNDDNDFIEVTEWTNGEGFDINIYTKNNKDKIFSLTRGELDAVNYLVKSLDYRDDLQSK